MNNNEKKQEFLNDLFQKNKIIKEKEIKTINNMKKMYNLIRKYEQPPFRYNDIIINSEVRVDFLINSIKIAFENEEIDPNTMDILLQIYEEIYDYLYKDSELEEIEIPEDLIKNLFDRTVIPDNNQLMFVFTLLRENKRIFDSEIDGKCLSQTIKEGLHIDITKKLKIEKENLSHLLGVTNDGSLYEFYRKTLLKNKISQILDTLGYKSFQDPNFNLSKFNIKFKNEFGLNFSKENCIKIINWRYDAKDDYLKQKNITVTKEEREILNQRYNYAPKSDTINFYCHPSIVDLLIKENNKIIDFICEYLRNIIVEKSKTKNNLNELKKIFTNEELTQILNLNLKNNNLIIKLINKYITQKKYNFEEDKKFKDNFINQFGYSYPLINYNELLSKNISFYNFLLFKNLNSLIVDYDSQGKQIKSNVFLASYSQNKMTNIKEKIIKLIKEKNKKYEQAITEEFCDKELDKNYIMSLRSLLNFPEESRYYFRHTFLSKNKQSQDNKIILDNTPKPYNITLIGFTADKLEETRINNLASKKISKQNHVLKCETNITSNYHQYIIDYTKNGIEYIIDTLDERDGKPSNRRTKILKIAKPLDVLSKYITLFEQCTSNIENENNIIYAKQLRENINKIIDDYQAMTQIKISIMEYRIETRSIDEIYEYRSTFEKEITEANKIFKTLSEYKEYIDEIINTHERINKSKKR